MNEGQWHAPCSLDSNTCKLRLGIPVARCAERRVSEDHQMDCSPQRLLESREAQLILPIGLFTLRCSPMSRSDVGRRGETRLP